ncbi:MAG: hypothetical protein COB01_02800 [Lutibacter sp.]|nr:MAG: hypothetical protein COB01_02800 [Lutibacter sp.]
MKEVRYIEFDKYLNNELSGAAIESFEKKLESNADFKQEFEIYKALENSLTSKFKSEKEEQELRNTLSNLGSKFIKDKEPVKKETKVISLMRYRNLMVAASIALLVGLFLFNNENPVYSDFSNHNSLELVVRSEHNEVVIKAQEAFNSENYEVALQQLTLLATKNKNDIEIELYKAICYLEINMYADADIIFDEISSGNSAFTNTAMWYKALSMLKQEQFEACKYVLQTIPKSAEEYKQAEKLLRKL